MPHRLFTWAAAVPGDVWSEAALDDFDRLTYCAQWRPLQAKLCSYSHSEVSSWPSVKLYDNNNTKVRLVLIWMFLFLCYLVFNIKTCLPQTLDIGEELIRLGHAVSFQEMLTARTEGDQLGSLQKLLVSQWNTPRLDLKISRVLLKAAQCLSYKETVVFLHIHGDTWPHTDDVIRLM